MGTVDSTGGFVPVAYRTERGSSDLRLAPAPPDAPRRIATLAERALGGLPGRPGDTRGVLLTVGNNTRAKSTSYFLTSEGEVYRRAGFNAAGPERWQPVRDESEIATVRQVVDGVRRGTAGAGAAATGDAPEPRRLGQGSGDAPTSGLQRGLEPPRARPLTFDGVDYAESSPDRRVTFKQPTVVDIYWRQSAAFRANVDFSDALPAGTRFTVDAQGEVYAQAPAAERSVRLGHDRPERIEALRYAWARYPNLDPVTLEANQHAALPRLKVRPLDGAQRAAPPIDLASMQRLLSRPRS